MKTIRTLLALLQNTFYQHDFAQMNNFTQFRRYARLCRYIVGNNFIAVQILYVSVCSLLHLYLIYGLLISNLYLFAKTTSSISISYSFYQKIYTNSLYIQKFFECINITQLKVPSKYMIMNNDMIRKCAETELIEIGLLRL